MTKLETLNKIGKLFIGDTHQIFPEKKGYQIVDFFKSTGVEMILMVQGFHPSGYIREQS